MRNSLATETNSQDLTPHGLPGGKSPRPTADSISSLGEDSMGSTALLADIIETTPGAICVYGPDLRVLVANQAFINLYPMLAGVLKLGVHMRDVIGCAIDHTLYPGAINDRRAFIENRVERRLQMGTETIHQTTKRCGAWIHIRESRSADGCLVIVHTDISERKRADEVRRESEARFRTAFEDASTGMMIATLEGQCIEANRAMCEMLGYEPGALAGTAITELVHTEDRNAHCLLANSLRDGDTDRFSSEQRYVGNDGRLIWAIGSASLLRNDIGEPVNTIWQLQDVTERKVAEDALKESEGRLRAIMDNSPAAIFLRDKEGRYLLANKAYEQRWGWGPGEAIGKSLFDLFPPEMANRFLASDRSVLTKGLAIHEGKVVLPTGEERTTLVMKFPLPAADGTSQGIGIISHDITDRKLADEALRASEARLRAIVENSPAAVYLRDKNGRYIVANKEFHRRYGLAPGSAIGMSPLDVLPTDKALRSIEVDREIMASRRAVSHEQVGVLADGDRQHVLVVKFPIIREDGEVESVGIISTDMTEMRKAEARLRQLQSELTHAYRLNIMGEMATGLAHELNQPLSAIVNYAQGCIRRMQSGIDGTDELVSAMNKISDQAQRAGHIIRWMRGFVRKGGDDKASVDLNGLIRECVDIMDHELDRHDIHLSLTLDQRLPLVFADRIQVQQVMLNLIRNGVEALMDCNREGRKLTITSIIREDAAEITVADNGPGMTEETQTRLFDPFYTTKQDGLGMGLSICRTVIEEHGGRLAANSATPKGSVLRFSVPFRGKECEEIAVLPKHEPVS